MRFHPWAITAIVCVALGALVAAYGFVPKNENHLTYSVVLPALPEKLDPWRNQMNVANYINMHLYYPLFERDQKGRLRSEFLDMERSKALDASFRKFVLCLAPGVKFSDQSAIEQVDLEAALRSSHSTEELLESSALIQRQGKDCVTVELPKADASYFDRLRSMSASILKSSTSASFAPVGLGPYRLLSMSRKTIELELREALGTNDRFRRLVFTSYDPSRKDDILDWNHLYRDIVPDKIKTSSQVFTRKTLKVYALILSYENEALRRQFVSCLDQEALAKATGIKLSPITGFLPSGVTGHDVDFIGVKSRWNVAACDFRGSKPKITFFNHNPEIGAALTSFFRDQQRRLPLDVVVKEIKSEDYAGIAFSQKPYVGIIGFDSSGSLAENSNEASSYFESFFRDERIIGEPLKKVENHVKAAIRAGSWAEKARLYRLAHGELLDSGYVVPLGRHVAEQYYPKWVSNITWEDDIVGFPRVDKMRIVQ